MATCCGGGGNPGQKKNIIVGGNPGPVPAGGMVLVEYIGRNAGDMTWPGVASRRKYVLGGVHRQGWVDRRDLSTGRSNAPGLLELKDGRNRVFQVVPVAEKAKAAPAAAEKMPAIPARVRGRRGRQPPEAKPASLRDIAGVGAALEKKLLEAGLTTPGAVVLAGVDGLTEIIGVRHAEKVWRAASELVG